ncbi:hypothetical protein SVIOM74S_09596 [Streptomyces violarus]
MEIEALVPYTHGKLVARAHDEGEVISEEHTPEGTLLKVRVHEGWRRTRASTFRPRPADPFRHCGAPPPAHGQGQAVAPAHEPSC